MAHTASTAADDGGGTDGESAPLATAATALADAVRTTLGPNGLDKMLIDQGGTVVVTNDGANILENVAIEAPVGRLVRRAAVAQAEAVGDGTTTAVVLTGELLKAAATLREQGVHPTTIVDGYAAAATVATRRLGEYALPVDSRSDQRLRRVAETAVTGRWDARSTERFAALTVGALESVDFDQGKLTHSAYAGQGLAASERVDGLVVDMDTSSTSLEAVAPAFPDAIARPSIAMVDAEVGISEPTHVESITLDAAQQADALRRHEADTRAALVAAVRESGADVLVAQKSIDDAVRSRLAAAGIMPVERTRRDEFDAIARATGSEPVQSPAALDPQLTGDAATVERRPVGTTETLVVEGCEERRASLLLRGGTPHVAEEVDRIVTDCLAVVRRALGDGAVVAGGGATAVALARDLSTEATVVADRRQLVLDAVARALEAVPRTLAGNAGRDPIDTLTELRRHHDAGEHTVGVGPDGEPREMVDCGVLEPRSVFERSLLRALDLASMVLRVDDVIATAASDDEPTGQDHASHDTGGYPWAIGH